MKDIGVRNIVLYLNSATKLIEECNRTKNIPIIVIKSIAAIVNILMAIAYIQLLDLIYYDDAELPY